MRRIIEFCNLEWEPACLKFRKTKRRVKTASGAQMRRKYTPAPPKHGDNSHPNFSP